MTQTPDPTYQTDPQSSAQPTSYVQPPTPYDDPASLHPHQRALLWGVRAITYLIYGFIVAVEIILVLGFLLLLFGANSSSSFVEWWYRNLERVMEPFRGIFSPIELGLAGDNEVQSVFDTSVVFAMIVYAIVGIAVYTLAQWLTTRIRRIDVEDREYQAQMARERQAYLDRASAERIAAAQAATTHQPPPPQT